MNSKNSSAIILCVILILAVAGGLILLYFFLFNKNPFLPEGDDDITSGSDVVVTQLDPLPDFRYVVENGGITLTEYIDSSDMPEIPDEIDGYKVLRLSKSVFSGTSLITSVILPDTLVKIDEGAFADCVSLEKITVATGVELVPADCFKGCIALKSVVLNGAKSIADGAFSGCVKLESVTVNGDILKLGNTQSEKFYSSYKNGSKCFEGCVSLKSLTVTGKIGTIYSGAFEGCTAFDTLLVGDRIDSVLNYAFYGCASLRDISVGGFIDDIDDYNAFEGTKIVPDADGFVILSGHILVKYTGTAKSVAIPEKVTCIAAAFRDNESITSVKLPAGLRHIGREAFADCIGLTSMNIPASVESWGWGAFHWCTGIKSVTLEDGLVRIGESAFFECKLIKKVTIPESVTEIGSEAFGYKGQSRNEITVYGKKGSIAESFAQSAYCKFVAV